MRFPGQPALIASCALLIHLLGACSSPSEYRLRPVDLHVVDAGTGKALRDISVYQVIESEVYGGCFRIFPKLEPTAHNYVLEAQRTGADGSVSFPGRSLNLACSEHVAHEYLIVNIDLKPGTYEEDLARLAVPRAGALVRFATSPLADDQEKYAATPNDRYRGYVIYGAGYEMGPEFYHGRQRLFDVITNGRGLLASSQSFTVRLDPAKAP